MLVYGDVDRAVTRRETDEIASDGCGGGIADGLMVGRRAAGR